MFCAGVDWIGWSCASKFDVIHEYHVRSAPNDLWDPDNPIKLRFGDKSFGYRHTGREHGPLFWGALKSTLEHPGYVDEDGSRFIFEKCFHNPFDSSEIATYKVVVERAKRGGHELGVVTAYWDGYYKWDAPWWAAFYSL